MRSSATAHSPLSLQAWEQIDRLCLEFEDAWLDGQRPNLEQYLAQAEQEHRAALLSELLKLDLEHRRRQGEQPEPRDYQHLIPSGPLAAEWEQAVRAAFAEAQRWRRALQPGERIGRYRIEHSLGRGAFGSVYAAWDERLERRVALKVPRRSYLSEEPADRWLEEARTAAQLRHPGIVPIFDVGEQDDGTLFLVMQCVEGGTLQEVLHRETVSWKQAVHWMEQIAEAVHYAQRRGFVHRDLKPSNILLDRDKRALVSDFGLAQRQRELLGDASRGAGTVPYLAPEQCRGGQPVGCGSDVWSLGVIFYELLTGSVPFAARDLPGLERAWTVPPPPPHETTPSVPRVVSRICMRCLQPAITQRYTSAGQLAQALRRSRQPWTSNPVGRLVLVGFFLVLTLLIAGLVPRHAGTAQVPDELTGQIDLLIWNPADPARQGLRVHQPAALPLRPGDQVRLEATVSQPAYLYLVWIDGAGQAQPVYPWEPGRWDTLPAEPTRRRGLSLPSRYDQAWVMQPGLDSMETVLLLVRRRPLPPGTDVGAMFEGLEAQPATHLQASYRFYQGRQEANPEAVSRPPNFSQSGAVSDAVHRNQQLIAERVRQTFDWSTAISFAFAGDTKGRSTPGRND